VDQRDPAFNDRVALPPPTFTPEPTAQGGPAAALMYVLLVVAAGLALISVMLAALPPGALERVLAADAHDRTEHIASFVEGHRLDIAVAGVAMLLIAAAFAVLPTVTG
jgi:hypothetical protein